jgi:cytochrome c-type biogenesis protein CcmE
MKRIHFISIALIAGAIVLLIMASGDLSTYGTFEEARKARGKVKIAGQLAKDKEMLYNPEEDPNYFSFYLTDQEGEEQRVILRAAKPTDFEMSEQIVVTGRWKNEQFIASDVLLKCPSKYKDEEIYLKEESTI